MARNFLYMQQDPIQALLQGFQGGQQIIGNINQQQMAGMKNQMLQNEMQKQQDVKNVLSQPQIDPQALMRADPEIGIKYAGMQRSQQKEQIEMAGAAADIAKKVGPSFIDNPQGYISFYKWADQMGLGGFYPHPATFLNKETGQIDMNGYNGAIKNMVAGADIIKEQLKPETFSYHPVQQGEIVQGTLIGNKGTINPIPGATGPKWDQDKNQITVQPDGTVTIGGSKSSPTGVALKTQGDFEDRLTKATGLMSQLTQMGKTYDPEFQTYGGKLNAEWTNFKSGLGFKNLSPGEVNYASRLYAHRSKSMEMLNSLIKEISGATVTDQEAARLKAQLPTAGTGILSGDKPIEFESKMNTMTQSVQRSIIRLNYLRKSGFSVRNNKELEDAINKTGITLDKMDMAIERGKALKGQGKTDDQIKQTLANEFGWVF